MSAAKHTRILRLLLLLATAGALAGVATASAAGSYGLDWWTADGGGASASTGDGYSLASTIGQPDAGPSMSGGTYSLAGGFWNAEPGFTLAITSAHGSVVKVPNTPTYHFGEVVELTATPDDGWTFANWSGDASGSSNPVSVTMSGNRSVTANYTSPDHIFADVPVSGKEWMEPWIEAFYDAGVTTGCGVSPLRYCPENQVTRAGDGGLPAARQARRGLHASGPHARLRGCTRDGQGVDGALDRAVLLRKASPPAAAGATTARRTT